MNVEQMRKERNKFEQWATAQGMSVGRNEFGYYDDDEAGSRAWEVWKAHALRQELIALGMNGHPIEREVRDAESFWENMKTFVSSAVTMSSEIKSKDLEVLRLRALLRECETTIRMWVGEDNARGLLGDIRQELNRSKYPLTDRDAGHE